MKETEAKPYFTYEKMIEVNKHKDLINYYHLRFNPQTDRYDSDTTVEIADKDLVDGHFPLKFGVIKGSFNCSSCNSLRTLEGGPTKVEGSFYCTNCPNLITLDGAPEEVGNNCNVSFCTNLVSIVNKPKKIGGSFSTQGCEKIIMDLKMKPTVEEVQELDGEIIEVVHSKKRKNKKTGKKK